MLRHAITPENLISKMCFTKFGGNLEQYGDEFRKELYHFRRTNDNVTLSRQAIGYWFNNKGVPKRRDALIFLRSFFSSRMTRKELTENNQKKVYDQILAFFNRLTNETETTVEAPRKYHVNLSNSKRLLIDQSLDDPRYQELSTKWEGNYGVYHVRLTENPAYPIAQEFLQIYSKGHEVRFTHWDQTNNGNPSESSGSVVLIGNSVWLIGVGPSKPNRLKTLVFRNVHSENETYNQIKWGVMNTEIPRQGTPEPVACRVVLRRLDIETMTHKQAENFARSFTRQVSKKECSEGEMRLICRLVNNNHSAMSIPQSIDPISPSGAVTDTVLRVSQETLERVCEQLQEIKN